MGALSFFALQGSCSVTQGMDVGKIVTEAAISNGAPLQEGDICVIAHKIVSKALGRVVDLSAISPRPQAQRLSEICGKPAPLLELMLQESEWIAVNEKGAAICRNKCGWTCANAGIDQSNAPEAGRDHAVLLPQDPDAAARTICDRIRGLTGHSVAVIISDTHGRPLREGIIGIAAGCWGIDPIRSYIGGQDREGRKLQVSKEAIADELAAGASLLMGQGDEGVPAVIVRGYPYTFCACGADGLKRDPSREIFRPVCHLEPVEEG